MGLADAAPLVEVDLPHDAMIHGRRSPDALTAEGQGWYEAEDLEYMKTFVVAADDQGKAIWLEFEGAYMNTTVCQPSSFRYNSRTCTAALALRSVSAEHPVWCLRARSRVEPSARGGHLRAHRFVPWARAYWLGSAAAVAPPR